MLCHCGGRLRVRQTREPMTCVAGRSGRIVEETLAVIGLATSIYVVRDRVCDDCGEVVGTAELQLDDLKQIGRLEQC